MTQTYPDVVKGQQLQILIGDGATPTEAFTKRCTINLARSIQFNAQTSNVTLPPCEAGDDPDTEEVAWQKTNVEGLAVTIEGAGYFHPADAPFFYNWWKSGQAKNIKFRVNKPGAPIWTGPFKLTTMGVNGEFNQEAQNSLTFVSDGAVALTAMPA